MKQARIYIFFLFHVCVHTRTDMYKHVYIEETERSCTSQLGERVAAVGGSRVNYRLEPYFVVLLFFNAPKGNERANASRHPEPANFYSYFMAINFFAVTLSLLPSPQLIYLLLFTLVLSSSRFLFSSFFDSIFTCTHLILFSLIVSYFFILSSSCFNIYFFFSSFSPLLSKLINT